MRTAYKVIRAALGMLGLGFNLIAVNAHLAPSNWIVVSGLSMQAIAAFMCAVEL